MMRFLVVAIAALGGASCNKADAGAAPSPEVSTLGKVEVTARLLEVRGQFPPNKLYDYAYVMKYRVLKTHRGKADGDEILVAHYNPLKPRSGAQDKFSGRIGGDVIRFQAGEVHRMALDAPLDDCYMGGIIDKHLHEKGARYWAIWTDRGRE